MQSDSELVWSVVRVFDSGDLPPFANSLAWSGRHFRANAEALANHIRKQPKSNKAFVIASERLAHLINVTLPEMDDFKA